LVCAYVGFPRLYGGQRRLDAADATSLASVINRIDVRPDIGVHSCPPDNGRIEILVFSFPGAADVDLWWYASGCESVDNGYAAAFEGGNPSFYNGFMGAMQQFG
jgi:hypothetical protein